MESATNYLTEHMYMTRDEVIIIDLLTDHHEMPSGYESDQAIKFFHKDNLHLVLYFATPGDRGFQMFVVEDFSQHTDELLILKDIFLMLISQGYSSFIFRKAYDQVENLIYMSGTFRAMSPRYPNEEGF
ncbi:hypothetical protein DYBT9275_00738 [Dyadobacter sp. CECT 9275]|uniref:Uncharacterized protein n=1 Tax=Dyadobacter helix TaxID=2822344 RepID=A0A916J807_9BACT|nr:hypothetical protein [Dyadobacter sp. CECT 9275]CAG4991382.1 hypothetical protein DYBT9275_00738 [Dyadobacter sp. CECT 9275]